MPAVKFNKKYLNSLLRFKISDADLKDRISELGLEVEDITADEIMIEFNTARPDLLDPVGLARAIRYFLHKSDRFHYTIGNKKPELTINVSKNVLKARPCIGGVVAKGIRFDSVSLQQMMVFADKFCDTFGRKRKKIAIGMHDLDSIASKELSYSACTDERFVPLNSKEPENFSSILKNSKKGIEYGNAIEDEGKLGYPALKDSEGVLALIPIINSDRTKVTTATKNMFVDVTGISDYAVEKSVDLLSAMLMDMGADVLPVAVASGSKKKIYPVMEQRFISISPEDLTKELGVAFDYRGAISLANKMGYEAALLRGKIRFSVPEYRLDIINEQDIIEDIAIAYGYDYIQPMELPYYQPGSLEQVTIRNRSLENALIGMGCTQVMNSYLTNESINYEKMNIKVETGERVALANSVNSSISMVRTWLLPSLMLNLGRSGHAKMPHKLFELDMAFTVKSGKPVEQYHLAAAISDPKANLNDIKAVIEELMYLNGVKYSFAKYSHKSFIEGRCGSIKANGKAIGFFGELHPVVLSSFGIEEPVSAFEINLDAFTSQASV